MGRANISTGPLPASLWKDLAAWAAEDVDNDLAGELLCIARCDLRSANDREGALSHIATMLRRLARYAKGERLCMERICDPAPPTPARPELAADHARRLVAAARLQLRLARVAERIARGAS